MLRIAMEQDLGRVAVFAELKSARLLAASVIGYQSWGSVPKTGGKLAQWGPASSAGEAYWFFSATKNVPVSSRSRCSILQ